MKVSGLLLLALFVISVESPAQSFDLAGGFTHITEDIGTNGFTVGAAGGFKNVQLAFDYDRSWGSSNLGNFVTTNLGLVNTKARMQNFLLGPRIHFPTLWKNSSRGRGLTFFLENQYGVSFLRETLNAPALSRSAFVNENNFSWTLGGGADYVIAPHFLVRFRGDLLRTHFVSQGASHFRLGLQLVYTFEANKPH